MNAESPQAPSLYDRLGGGDGIRQIVQGFYFHVFLDPRVAGFFGDFDSERLLAHQREFLTYVLGGPHPYSGRSLRAAHSRLVDEFGLDDSHFNAVSECLAMTLNDFDVDAATVDAVLAVVESVRDDVLGR
ncbi:MAG: group 1 truncated hemoglobin [Pseudomonadota bacterium]